jgi:hypothetical protein
MVSKRISRNLGANFENAEFLKRLCVSRSRKSRIRRCWRCDRGGQLTVGSAATGAEVEEPAQRPLVSYCTRQRTAAQSKRE